MHEISNAKRERIERALRDRLGYDLSGFHVEDGVLQVSVVAQDATTRVPGEIEGFPTQVHVEPLFTPDACFHGGTSYSPKDRQNKMLDPVPTGVQYHAGGGYCTTGALTVRNGKHFFLSAGHCGLASFPNNYKARMKYHGNVIGGQFRGPPFYLDERTNMDYAYSPLSRESEFSASSELLGLNAGPTHAVNPNRGETVYLLGARSGIQSATVRSTGFTYGVAMKGEVVYLSAGISTTSSFSQSGDSGSMWVVHRDGKYHPCAIHSAGSDNRSVGCALRPVLRKTGLKVLTGRKVAHPGGSESKCVDVPLGELIEGGENGVSVVPGGD